MNSSLPKVKISNMQLKDLSLTQIEVHKEVQKV